MREGREGDGWLATGESGWMEEEAIDSVPLNVCTHTLCHSVACPIID